MEENNTTFGIKGLLGLFALGLVASAILAYFSNYWPHILGLAGILIAASATRFFDTKVSRILCSTGIGAVVGTIIVVLLSLNSRPINDDGDTEDRSDFAPKPIVQRTPQELLAVEWSTSDQNSDWPVAALMLELSDIAYQSPVEARRSLKEMGFSASESINAGSMQGYVIDAGDDSIIALRGTESHEYDLLQDLRFLRRKTDDGSMHGGFASGYDPMHSQVLQLLEQYETKRVWLTGHSLGGALAVVCAYRLSKDGDYPIAGVMTFGQPKVVRSDMAEFLGEKLAGRYVFFVNQLDPVARLINPYEHFGHMVWWDGSKIERSKYLVLFGAGDESGATNPISESGYVESMSDEDLNELIRELEQSGTPTYDKDGNLVVQGVFDRGRDHYLDSYREMLEVLRTHRSASTEQ